MPLITRLLPLLLLLLSFRAFAVEASPFAEACQAPEALVDRPATGLLHWTYPQVDKNGREAGVFLASVLGLAIAKLDKDLTFTENLTRCLTKLRGQEVCAELENFAVQQLPSLIKDVRFHLLASQSPKEIKSSFGSTDTSPNYRMRDWGTVKVRAWDRPSRDEYDIAHKVLRDYKKEIVAHYLKQWNQDVYKARYGERVAVNDSLFAIRLQHFQQYRSFLAAAPFLQYFSSAHPDVPEILERFKEFELNAEAEKAYLQALVLKLQAGQADNIGAALTAAMQYNAYIEFALLEQPQYCGLMTSLMYTQMNRSLSLGIGIGVPLLLASFFAPGIFAYPLGIIASGYFALESYNEYELARIRAQSVLFLDPGTETNLGLIEAQDRFTTEVLLFPLSFVGGRVVGTSLRSFAAGRAIKNVRLNGMSYLPKYLLKTFETFGRKKI